MGFFDSLPRPEPAPRLRRPKPPAWACPEDVVPACVPFTRLLVHTTDLAVFVDNVRVYPNGVELTVHVRRPRNEDDVHDREPVGSPFGRFGPFADSGDSADRYLRLGVHYADGRRARADRAHRLGSTVEPPLVSYSRAGGGEGYWDQDVWIWGLPAEGSVTVVYSWLAEDVPEASFVLDGQELRAAATRATTLWPEPCEPSEPHQPPGAAGRRAPGDADPGAGAGT